MKKGTDKEVKTTGAKRGRPTGDTRTLKGFKQAFLNDSSDFYKEVDTTLSLYGLDRAALLKACSHITDLKSLEDRLVEVVPALEYYKDSTPERGKLDSLLKDFREHIGSLGFLAFNVLNKHIIPIVYLFGDTIDRAALAFSLYFDMRSCSTEEPLITREYANEMREKIIQSGKKAREEFQLCIILYESLNVNRYILESQIFDYMQITHKAAYYIATYKAIQRADYYSSDVASLVPDALKQELEQLNEYNLKFFKELSGVPLSEATSMDELQSKCIEQFSVLAHNAERKLSRIKGTIEAFKSWIGKHHAWGVIPMAVRNYLDFPEFKSCSPLIPAEFRRDYIENRKKKGEPVQNFMREIALFPSYEDTRLDKETAINITKKLDGTYKESTQLHGI